MRYLLSALLFCWASAFAAVAPESGEPDLESSGWVELEASLPLFPKPSGLVEFAVSGASDNHFLIDVDTLSIGKDGVVRYVLVVRSPRGAENLSFEGIRCAKREQKFYAFGQRNGTWARVQAGQWRVIENREINRQHIVLYTDFLCPDGALLPRSVRDIVQRLRYGAPRHSGG